MIQSREVRAERHVVEIRVGLGRIERCIDQLFVVARQRDVPHGELLLQRAELSARQCVTESAGTAVRQESHATIAQAEHLCCATRAIVVEQAHYFAFAEMIAAAIRTKLRDLFEEVGELVGAQPVEPQRERGIRSVVGDVCRVFATLRPGQGNAERVQYLRRRAVRGNLHPERFSNLASLSRGTLAATRAGGCPFENRINERATDGFVRNLVRGQVELQEAHRTLDVHADRAGINVRRRRENATNWRTVASVRVWIEHEIGHAGRATGVERLLKTRGVEPGANGVRADDGDGLALIARRGNEAQGLTGRVDLGWVGVAHFNRRG